MLLDIGKHIASELKPKLDKMIDEGISAQPLFLSKDDEISLKKIIKIKLYQKLESEIMNQL